MPIRPRDRQTRSSPLVFRNCSIPLGRFAGTAVELLYNAINNKMNRRIGDRLTTATRDHLRQGYEAIMSCRAPAQGSGFYIVEISRNGRDFITTGFVFQYGGFKFAPTRIIFTQSTSFLNTQSSSLYRKLARIW